VNPFDGDASGAEDTGVMNATAPMAAAANVVLVNTVTSSPVQMTALVRVSHGAPKLQKLLLF
jgi:hypothetical protein